MRLPTEPSIPKVSLRDFRFLLHGWPKVGKTSTASFWPGAIFLRMEEGTKAIRVYALPEEGHFEDWDSVGEAIELLKKEGKKRFQTVVIDTVERFYDLLCQAVAAEEHVSHISECGYGKGYAAVNRRLFNALEALYADFGVVLISHSRQIESPRGGMMVQRIVPDLSNSPREVVTGWVDSTVYLEAREEVKEGKLIGVRHVAVCQAFDTIEAGGRLELEPEIDLGASAREGFANFNAAFEVAASKLLEEYGLLKETPSTRRRKK